MNKDDKNNGGRWFSPRLTLGELILVIGMAAGLFHFGLGERDREAQMRERMAVLTIEVEQLKLAITDLKILTRRMSDKIDSRFGFNK